MRVLLFGSPVMVVPRASLLETLEEWAATVSDLRPGDDRTSARSIASHGKPAWGPTAFSLQRIAAADHRECRCLNGDRGQPVFGPRRYVTRRSVSAKPPLVFVIMPATRASHGTSKPDGTPG
jgi:hypothetical protein